MEDTIREPDILNIIGKFYSQFYNNTNEILYIEAEDGYFIGITDDPDIYILFPDLEKMLDYLESEDQVDFSEND